MNYKVTASSLNVRRGPNLDEPVVDLLFEGQIVSELPGGLGIFSEGPSTALGASNFMRIDGDEVPDGWAELTTLTTGADDRVAVSGTSGVNVRALPTSVGPVIGALHPGEDFPVGPIVSNDNRSDVRRWIHLALSNGRSGFASMAHLTADTSAAPVVVRNYRVTADSLSVRANPDIDARIVGFLRLDASVPEGQIVESGGRRWMKIATPGGYASMKFLSLEPASTPATGSGPRWYQIARTQLGVKERAGEGDNPEIVKYHRTTNLPTSLQNQDETAWCSSFVNWCMEQAGIEGTDSASARSWLRWGQKITTPTLGCVVVFRRGNNPAHGHVALFVRNVGDEIEVLGGNQNDAVTIARYAKSRLLGYRVAG